MRKFLILCLVFLSSTAFANPLYLLALSGTGLAAGPPVTFYFNADSATTGQAPQKGSGTVTIGASVSAVAGSVGNALTTNAGWSAGRISWPQTGNLDYSVGTLGFWYTPNAHATGVKMYAGATTGDASFVLSNINGTSTGYYWRYKNTETQLSALTAATPQWIELAWDNTNTRMAYRVNGGSWVENTSVTGTLPSLGTVIFGSVDGTSPNSVYDQIMFSGTYRADLDSVKMSTNP